MVRHAGMAMTATGEEVYYSHRVALGAMCGGSVVRGGQKESGYVDKSLHCVVVSTGKSRGGKANSFRTGHLE